MSQPARTKKIINPYLIYNEEVDYTDDQDDDQDDVQADPVLPPAGAELLESSSEGDASMLSLSIFENSRLQSTMRRSEEPGPSTAGVIQPSPPPGPAELEGQILPVPPTEAETEEASHSSDSDEQSEVFQDITQSPESDMREGEKGTSLSLEDINVVPLTVRGDLSKELDTLIARGVTPPQPPPRNASGVAPVIPARQSSRPHSFKGNYKDLHTGRIHKNSN